MDKTCRENIVAILHHYWHWSNVYRSPIDIHDHITTFKIDLIMWALAHSKSITEAGRKMKMKRSTLSEMMKKYGIIQPPTRRTMSSDRFTRMKMP